MIEDQLQLMEKRLDEIEEKFDKMDEKLGKIYDKLVGDTLSPKGFIHEFNDLKEEVRILSQFRNRISWTIGIVGGIGAIIGFLLNFITRFL